MSAYESHAGHPRPSPSPVMMTRTARAQGEAKSFIIHQGSCCISSPSRRISSTVTATATATGVMHAHQGQVVNYSTTSYKFADRADRAASVARRLSFLLLLLLLIVVVVLSFSSVPLPGNLQPPIIRQVQFARLGLLRLFPERLCASSQAVADHTQIPRQCLGVDALQSRVVGRTPI